MQVGSRFCPACGFEIGSTPHEIERRQLTLLFSDVVGSSALSERLDAEDWHELLTSYHRVCRDAIGRHAGHISQYLGDGVMSYFGYPLAHEDDAVRAVGAALCIVEDLEFVNHGIGERLGAEIHVRVGLHSGVAVVGEAGPGGARDRLAVGETVNLAARIQTSADPDTVVVSASTAHLVRGYFELEALNEHTLKGFSRPIELFRVLRPTGVRSRLEATARGRMTPFVGRENELSVLAAAWQAAQDGQDQVVIVRGEAGIGKSRLFHQFRQDVPERGARLVECFCSPLTQATAFAPVIDMLQGRIIERVKGNSSPTTRLDALGSLLTEHARFGPDALPLLADVLSLPGADESPIQQLSPPRRRARTLETLRDWVASAGERLPVALLVEDVHWADPSTLELLDLIVRESPGGRTLVCMTSRPEFGVRWSGAHVQVLELPRLQSSQVEAIVAHVAGGRSMPPLVVRRIAERSEGVPLFTEEVTKAVLESGALRLEGNHYGLLRPMDEHFLPSTVHGSLVARFDRLGDSRSVAQIAAAIGREFSFALVRAVLGATDAEVLEHMERLGNSELVLVQGEPPQSRYVFKHALIQDAIYATMLKGDRARVHETIFSALQRSFPEVVVERPEMVAYHAEQAGRRDAAVPLLRRAGANALGRTALAEAVRHLAHGIALVGALSEPDRRTMEIELQAAIGPAYMATVGWAAPEVERSCARLRELAASADDSQRLFQAMWGLWTVHFLRGQLEPALDVANQVLEMALKVKDPALCVAGHHAVGYTHFYRGEYAEAIQHADDGLALFELDRERQIAAVFQLSSSCALACFRAQAEQVLGRAQQASQSIEMCQQLEDALDHAPSRAYSLCMCYFFRLSGEIDQVNSVALAARSISLAEGFAFWGAVADIILAWVSAGQGGDPLVAAHAIEVSRQLIHAGRTYLVEPEYASMHAEVLLLARQPEQALRVLQDAQKIATLGGQRHGLPELFRLQGEAARVLGDGEQAHFLYRQGIESARAVDARLLELRCALALARLTGGSEERAELRRILDKFANGLDQLDCRQALEFLTQVAS